MWIEAFMQDEPGGHTPVSETAVIVLGSAMVVAGVIQLIRPQSLPAVLRSNSKPGDRRRANADAFERAPWKGRLVGVLAILWGLLFVGVTIYVMMNSTS
jgi:uncharacterized membrane protein HdeD (DUF308 family)